METSRDIWPFVLALAAVINGLGIVRLLNGFGEYLRSHKTLEIQQYWVYSLLVLFQLLVHLLLWWAIIGLRELSSINFLNYLYLLVGPTLLFLGTSLVLPDLAEESHDLRTIYYGFRKTYFTILAAFCVWAILLWPAFGYSFSPTAPLIAITLFIALILLMTDNPKIHATLMLANLVVYIFFIAIFAMKFGHVSRHMTQ